VNYDPDRALDDLNEAFIEALRLIEALKRGSCWCEIGIGNPMLKHHTAACEHAGRMLSAYRKKLEAA
jgi:hypothetical protein